MQNTDKKSFIRSCSNYVAACIFFIFSIIFTQPFILKSHNTEFFKYSVGDFEFIYYNKGYSYLIPHSARGFINALDLHNKIFEYKPDKPIYVFVEEFADFGSGGAISIPNNFVILGINPFDNIYENAPANERIQWLATHELTHIVMSDKPGPTERFFRNLFFGKPINDNSNPVSMIFSYLASPRWYAPRWYQEGIAIFMETFMNGGSGRLLGGYDEMVFRTMVLDSAYFFEPIGLETEGTTQDFMVGANAYLYGARFVSFLAGEYGKDKLLEFFTRKDEGKGFFASQFKSVYGNSLTNEWKKWVESEKNFQKKNIEIINSEKVTNHRRITKDDLGSASRQFFDKKRNSIITAINYPGNLAHIAEICLETGNIREIAPVKSPRLLFVTNIAYNEEDGIVIYTDNNMNYRDLCFVDINNGKLIKRLEYLRLGDLAFNKADKSIWGIRSYNGRNNITRLLPPYDKPEELLTLPFGNNFFDLDISPDGKFISGTYDDVNGKQKVVIYAIEDLLQGNNNFTEIFEFDDNSASNFTFSNDGKFLFGTSYITGVSNIFRINLEKRDADILTNTERGYFRPLQINSDSLIAFSYSTNGLSPVILKIDTANTEAINLFGMKAFNRNPELKNWNLPPLSNVNLDSLGVKEEKYSPIGEMRLAYIIPIIEGYRDYLSYGISGKLFDKIFFNGIDFSLSYSPNIEIPDDERIHLNLKYYYYLWEFTFAWNKANFYDIFGPTKLSREGGAFSAKYNGFLMPNRAPEKLNYHLRGAYYFDLKTLPLYQNIRSDVDRLISADANIYYRLFRKSLGAVDDESGYEYSLSVINDYAGDENFFKLYGNISIGSLLPIRNSSVWLRLKGGKSFGTVESPFNYFYFGGFGNNYLDNFAVSRYRELMSVPGVEINSIAANSFAKATLEWNLPPIRFRKFGILPAYFTYSRLSLFGTGLAYDFDNIKNGSIYSLGCQVDFELSMFYLLKTWLSFGYAGAFRYGEKPSDEFMISLKF